MTKRELLAQFALPVIGSPLFIASSPGSVAVMDVATGCRSVSSL
ncbi:MAG: hypothetical protein ACKVQQ_14875 [Burkholderiales bacterium]